MHDIFSVVIVSEKRSEYDLIVSYFKDQDQFPVRSYWQPDLEDPFAAPVDTVSQIDCFILISDAAQSVDQLNYNKFKNHPLIVVSQSPVDDDLEEALKFGASSFFYTDELTSEVLIRSIYFAQGIKQAESLRSDLQKRKLDATSVSSLGKIASRIAHDLNNTLGAIIGHLDLIKLSAEDDSDVTRSADLALESSERARLLIEHVSAFSDQERSDRKLINLQQTVLETVDLLNRLLPRDIKVSSQVDRSQSLHVNVNPVELRQVLINIAINAQEAMPKGGSLFFEFQVEEASSLIGHPNISNSKLTERYVCLSVRDTGSGIDPENLEHVFEPSFTTKDDSSLGLGLSTVFKVLQEHEGWVDIKSKLNEGTTVFLYFPLYKEEDGRSALSSNISMPKPSTSKKGTVLVIEDESILCELVKLYLEAAGFEAVIFTRPTEALIWFEEHATEIDMILLDMLMPELSGKQCFEKLQKINPATPIALCSGFLDKDVQSLLQAGAVKFFQKPGRYPLMVTWIAEALQKG